MKLQNISLTLSFNLLILGCFAQNLLNQTTERFLKSSEFQHATISLLVVDTQKMDTLIEHQPNLSLPTASTAKLFSTAAAIEILGPNYRPKTLLYTDGNLTSEGVLNGNLWVIGQGDPTLGSIYFNRDGEQQVFLKKWCDTLQQIGIKKINGDIICDGSAFGYEGIPDGWSWGDMGNYYGAGPSGLCIYDNMLRFYFNTTAQSGMASTLLRTFPVQNDLVFFNEIRSASVQGDNSYIYGSPYSNCRWGRGSLPVSQAQFEVKGSLPDPEKQVGTELLQFLQKRGVTLSGSVKTARMDSLFLKNVSKERHKLLYTHDGPTIGEIVNITNHHSINLFAEQLVCLAGYKKTGIGSISKGLDVLEQLFNASINTKGLFLKDGSGLSRSNGISAANLVSLLVFMNQSQHKTAFFNSLPISGKSGTLKSVCMDQSCSGKVFAKSGTMSRIKSYAGYIKTNSGKLLAFAFVLNNFEGGSKLAVRKMEALLNQLVLL
jgi:D-alanyl-D-alanine carboxypeptidase/D-alanyl-D-alanine-endopeptidase (penicillin-binding protein 4)